MSMKPFERAEAPPGGSASNSQRTVPAISDAQLASVLDTAADGIIIIDERGIVLTYNKACEHLFGYTAVEMLGRNVNAIMPTGHSRAHDGYIGNYLSSGHRKIIGIGREVMAQHRDGTMIPVHLSVGEAVTSAGRQFIGIMRDLRDRNESEQRLNQLQANLVRMARVSAVDEMGAALAHELNQPLTALMLYLQAVERSCAKQGAANAIPTSVMAILEKAVHEAERAGSIIQRMRQFIEKRDPVRRLVDLNPLIEDALELTILGSPPGTRIMRDFGTELPPVLVDPVQIQQVVVNLVRNALEAIKCCDVQVVRLSTKRVAGGVAMSVLDSGPGIRPEGIGEMFKAFSSSKSHGLGLGLAISKSIAQTHGGDLSVDPGGGGGRGACFTLLLPLPDDATAGATAETKDGTNGSERHRGW
ncbi:MAG: PAS domain S-box protein [Rhodoplanes sp.]|uniref:two-component system sensor histidine kinase NtrB n=1 Tax=Rhodoplanes sp. TaxID=1968906 RepID=UPI0017C83731|nr:PAS domain S-box protein [Rhodoplanes sp.]NVO15607.1 PAS domain S-box protein [Rhodoplanes sp.]